MALVLSSDETLFFATLAAGAPAFFAFFSHSQHPFAKQQCNLFLLLLHWEEAITPIQTH